MKINFKTISCMFLVSVLSILPLQAEVITINDNGVDVPTIVHNNRKHIPLRIVANQLGLNVAFDNSTKTITIKDAQNIMVMKIGSKMYTMNDITYEMDTMPLVQEGVTYLPLRVLGESFCTEFTFIDNHITLVREPSVVDTIVPKKAYVFRDTSYDFPVEVLMSYPIDPFSIPEEDRPIGEPSPPESKITEGASYSLMSRISRLQIQYNLSVDRLPIS